MTFEPWRHGGSSLINRHWTLRPWTSKRAARATSSRARADASAAPDPGGGRSGALGPLPATALPDTQLLHDDVAALGDPRRLEEGDGPVEALAAEAAVARHDQLVGRMTSSARRIRPATTGAMSAWSVRWLTTPTATFFARLLAYGLNRSISAARSRSPRWSRRGPSGGSGRCRSSSRMTRRCTPSACWGCPSRCGSTARHRRALRPRG